jgi:predicted Rossmann-fold nucleotide-binding protein
MKRIAVYCGSAPGRRAIYMQTARDVGRRLALLKVGLVYGGARVGTMGALADACLEAGGEVIGVIVEDMHERKAKMASFADAFLALPGGAGTMEELFEMWTWSQIGLHDKPCAILNLEGFYDPLLMQVERMVEEGLMQPNVRDMLHVGRTLDEAFDALSLPSLGK